MRDTQGMKRIVVKVGTNTLCDPGGAPDRSFLKELARDIHLLRSQGKQVIIITSGAIGSGMGVLGLRERPQDVTMRQALAALGQHRLMEAWQEAFARHKAPAGQILVTHHTFNKRRSYVNLRACIEQLLALGAIPVINENDTVSVQEIDATFGDNDRLGALVAAKMEADLYVILSDVDGLYDKPPHLKGAKKVDRVKSITPKIIKMAGEKGTKGGTGGMASKVLSAQYLMDAGVPVCIAYGRRIHVLNDLLDPENAEPIGTWFQADGHRDGVQRWLAAAHPQGSIAIDAGAVNALHQGFHLLPAGVRGVAGTFPVETVVDIVHDGVAIARAVSQLSSSDLEKCQGMQSNEAKEVLGMDTPVNVTKKGRLVLLD